MLARFDRRADLRAHRDALAYSGIAGTTIWFPFFYPTALWLAQRWPTRLVLERADTEAGDSIADLLPALLTPVEAHGLRESKLPGFEALDAVRGRETDATFLVRRVSALPADERTREAYYDAINPSCELLPGTGHAEPHARCAARRASRCGSPVRCGASGPTSRRRSGVRRAPSGRRRPPRPKR